MQLFQYWDSPDPPEEVASWIDGFRGRNPELEHRLFDEAAAADFIGAHFGSRELAAFRALAMPAMQSDYFRLCALYRCGGVYVDADFESREPLAGLLSQAPHGLVLVWFNEMINGLILIRQPADPFIGACLKLATGNIEQRRFRDASRQGRFHAVRLTAGIGLMNALWALIDETSPDPSLADTPEHLRRKWDAPELLPFARDAIEVTPDLTASFRSLTRLHMLETARWLGTPTPAYKDTGRHWLKWEGAVYRD